MDQVGLVLMGNWNSVLDTKIMEMELVDSLVDLIGKFGLVDRYLFDHSGQEM